jgi:hypothetical protein
MIEEIAPEEKERRFNEALDQLQRTAVIAVLPQGLTAPAFSFPFYFLLNAFFPARLSRWTHELVATFTFFSDQNLVLRSDNFLDWPQIGKDGTACF